MAEVPEFISHRRRGVAHAQAASGNLWTDYNVHDPGVTLLEQFCFALTELEYRSGFEPQDLLTGETGELDLEALGLHVARQVLPTRPVTTTDLSLALVDRCKLVRRVMITAGIAGTAGAATKTADRRGLYDIYVVPDRDAKESEVLDQVRQAYHAMRNLGEDIGKLQIAKPLPCRLQARIEVQRRHTPERVAALIYDRCALLMTEGDAAQTTFDKVTRPEAFDRPEMLFGKRGELRDAADALNPFFLALTGMPEVKNILSLNFEVIGGLGGDPFRRKLADGEYRKLVFPSADHEVELTLTSRGLDIRFDLAGMQKELRRARSERRESVVTHIDPAEWDRAPIGKRRSFDHARIGEALPAAYAAGHDLPSFGLDAETRRAALQLRGYLAFSDAPLSNSSADLANLPLLFMAEAGSGASYSVRPLDFGAAATALSDEAGKLAAISAEFDPWRDRKGRALDYLLGLYGEPFSQNSLRQHDIYHGPEDRQDQILRNRARLLQEIDTLDHDRAAAADFTASQSSQSVGMGRKLTVLLGFADRHAARLSAALERVGLSLVPAKEEYGEALVHPRHLIPPNDPFLAAVPRLADVPEFAQSTLISRIAFLRHGTVNAHVFRRGAQLDAYALAQDLAGHWGLFLDVNSDDGVLPCGKFATREAAMIRANQLCRMLADLNMASEGLYLVEDVLLRGTGCSYVPMLVYVVIAGWTARTVAAEFRQLAEETVRLCCPAHILPKVIWLDFDQTIRFQTLQLAWRIAYRDYANGREQVDGLDDAAQAMRQFLLKGGRA